MATGEAIDRARSGADKLRASRSLAKQAAADVVAKLAAGEHVDSDRMAELSMMDLAVIAYDMEKGTSVGPKDRIQAHNIILERLKGKPTQKTESESTNRFIFEPPDWWGPEKEKPVELAVVEHPGLPPAA